MVGFMMVICVPTATYEQSLLENIQAKEVYFPVEEEKNESKSSLNSPESKSKSDKLYVINEETKCRSENDSSVTSLECKSDYNITTVAQDNKSENKLKPPEESTKTREKSMTDSTKMLNQEGELPMEEVTKLTIFCNIEQLY